MTKLFVLLVASALLSAAGNSSPAAVVQSLFNAMSAHDADAARSLFTPDAALLGVRPDGTATAVPHEKWIEKLKQSKDKWLERTWSPQVLEQGPVAVFWAEYDFHLNGKLSHCGIDAFTLLKTSEGWKIASVADTRESACSPSPLGPSPQ